MVTIDFEFAQSQEWRMRVVCCVLQATGDPGSFDQKDLGPPERYWTDGPVNEAWMLKSRLSELWALGHVFVAYGATAEVRAMLSLEVDHLGSYRFIDLYAEWKQQQNNCNRFQYGCYFVAGRRFDSIPPEFEKRLNKGKNNKQVGGSLGACVGNLFQVDIDQARKNRMRDLIISNPPSFAEDEKQEILDYCESDIAWLPAILDRCLKELRAVTGEPASRILGWMELRGRWAVSLARMETLGIPLDVDAIFNLSANYEEAKDELIRDCNKTYPWFTDERKAKDFYPKWTAKYEVFAAFLQERGLDRGWPRTETGDYASDEKQLEAFDGIPELHALRVTKKALGQLKWFRPEALPEFLGDVGDDGRLRPFFGPWGTQSSRNAPPAKRFPPAMSAWLRCIMRPPKGSAICGIDWASQEFAGAAQISEDEGMQEAYRSGDPYVWFARSAGAIPKDAVDAWIKSPAKAPPEQQEEYRRYEMVRGLSKSTCLGLQYGMGANKLAGKLSADLGEKFTEDQASDQIDLHKQAFPEFWAWKRRIVAEYREWGCLQLADGWLMLGDNEQDLSVANFPIQGAGAACMREAVWRAQEAGIRVLFPLHDAIYCEYDTTTQADHPEILARCMDEAVTAVMGPGLAVRTEAESHDHDHPWVERKGKRHYEALSKYLLPRTGRRAEEEKLRSSIFLFDTSATGM